MLIRIKNIFLFILLVTFALNSVAQNKSEKKKEETDTTNNPPRLGTILKPTIGLGAGTLSYFGNIYPKGQQLQSITQSRIGYDLNLSQPLATGLYLNFYVMFGKLGANERSATPALNQNFESQIRMGGIQLMYDFSHFIKKQRNIRPYILTGFEGFEFLSKTDLYDKHGNKYYYWTDGTIKNMPQGSAGSQNAQTLVRDYTYDSDIREMNQNGYGKYRESSWAIPIGAGFTMNAGEHIKFRMGATMHVTFTNHIDGVGNTKDDKFLMFNASVHYDLYTRKLSDNSSTDTLPEDYYNGVDFAAIDNGDEDGDGVKDLLDLCHGTPAGAKVDANGCPVDEDKDLTPDYRDEELPTKMDSGVFANDKGIAMTNEDYQTWYNQYYDSTGQFAKVVDLGGPEGKGKKPNVNPQARPKDYTVELVRYKGGIPPDEMAYLLSIGDIRSFNYNDTTVVYAAGSYEDVRYAVKRRDEYIGEGLKSAKVGYFKGEQYNTLSDAELEKELAEANKKGALNNNTIANNTSDNSEGAVNKGIIYRVQLGAYKNKLSPALFKKAGKVIELKTEDGYYKYASGSYKTLADAAAHKAELVYEGYEDAFITAYEKGKRVPLNKVGATFEDKNYKENLNESTNTGSAIDKSLVNFRVQLGPLKKMDDTSLDETLKELKDVDKEPTTSGLMRITAGEFKNYNDAIKYKNTLVEKGITGAFVIGTFKGEVISIQEALDLLK
ncbi:MAG TPA: SPOR domain-containing protein [Bacteroidia bacterium]|nr:SPOR domain-containing protein [Bacteroidia bacterium]